MKTRRGVDLNVVGGGVGLRGAEGRDCGEDVLYKKIKGGKTSMYRGRLYLDNQRMC